MTPSRRDRWSRRFAPVPSPLRLGDLVDRQVGGLEQAAGLVQPLHRQPAQWRRHRSRPGSGGRTCAATTRRAGPCRRRSTARRGRPASTRRSRPDRSPAGGSGSLQELGLPTGAVRRHHHPAGQRSRDGGAVVPAHHVDAQVDARRETGTGEHLSGRRRTARGGRRRPRDSASASVAGVAPSGSLRAARRAAPRRPARRHPCRPTSGGRRGRGGTQCVADLRGRTVVRRIAGDDDGVGLRQRVEPSASRRWRSRWWTAPVPGSACTPRRSTAPAPASGRRPAPGSTGRRRRPRGAPGPPRDAWLDPARHGGRIVTDRGIPATRRGRPGARTLGRMTTCERTQTAHRPAIPRHIGILLFDGVEELDAIGPWEVLSWWTRSYPEDGYTASTLLERRPGRSPATRGSSSSPTTRATTVPAMAVLLHPGGDTRALGGRPGAPRLAARSSARRCRC